MAKEVFLQNGGERNPSVRLIFKLPKIFKFIQWPEPELHCVKIW